MAPSDKVAAREAVASYLGAADETTRQRLVLRINDEHTRWFDDDLALLVATHAPAVMLPKAEAVATLARLRGACPGIGVLALIESARGVLNAEAMAAADGVQRLVFGTLVTADIHDAALLRADFARARAHGFGAKLCIHPQQVAWVHEALRTAEAEIEWAQRVLEAAASTPGAVQLDGRMVDRPVVERARRLLQRAGPR